VVTYRVPAGSMLPTLQIGQIVDVDPSAYARVKPADRDIVVFHPPRGADLGDGSCQDPSQGAGHSAACSRSTRARSSQTFIKRIVAGPGDRLSRRNGVWEKDSYIEPCRGGPRTRRRNLRALDINELNA